jgi:NitT/TauT family transport system substrate-binding protein
MCTGKMPTLRMGMLVLLSLVTFGVASAQTPLVHVGVSAFEAQAEAYYAQDLGLFKRAGLNIDVQQFPGGSAIVAGIVGGALQIGAGNPLPLAAAHEHGIDVVLIAPGALFDSTLPLNSGFMIAASSTVRTGKDLNGKTLAVNALHSLDQIAASAWIDRNGGDSSTLKWVEIPNSAMSDAIGDGRVAGAMVADPGFTMGLTSGKVRVLANANDAIAKRFMATGFFATRAWADANPEVARKFAAAIDEAAVWAVKNPEAAAAVLRKYLKVTTTRAHEYHVRRLDPVLLQPLLDAAAHYKVLPQPLDAGSLLWY